MIKYIINEDNVSLYTKQSDAPAFVCLTLDKLTALQNAVRAFKLYALEVKLTATYVIDYQAEAFVVAPNNNALVFINGYCL